MGLNAANAGKGGGLQSEPLANGAYPVRLVQIIDLGVQEQRPFQGKDKDPAQELMLTYEFADEFMKDEDGNDVEDKPRWLSETMPLYNLNSEKARSTQRYFALDPTCKLGGDFAKLGATPVMVTIVQNPGKGKNAGKVYENVAGLSPMREKDIKKLSPMVNEPRVFDLSAPDLSVFEQLPKWVQDKIQNNLEFKGSVLEVMLEDRDEENKADAKDAPDVPEEAPY